MDPGAIEGIKLAIARYAPSIRRQTFRYGVHLFVVYLCARHCPFWLVEIFRLSAKKSAGNDYQFVFSHLLLLCAISGFLGGLLNARFRHWIALYVWIPPTIILAVTIVLHFPEVLFEHQFGPAFQFYFGSHFNIPQFQTYDDILKMGNTVDLIRSVMQLRTTAPFYTSVAYSLAAWLSMQSSIFFSPKHADF